VTANSGTEVIGRVLRLAAYLKSRRAARVALDDICRDVPGYDSGGELVRDAQWEAVRKKVRRDVALLGDSFGIEVDYDASADSYALKPSFLTADERDVLLAASALVRVDGIDDTQLAALGSAVDEEGRRVVMRVHRHVLVLRDALAARRPVTFRYHGQERVFDPWAVGLWRDRWYAVGYAHGPAERRVYRLDRIEERDDGSAISGAGADASYDLPAEFDPESALLLDPNAWGHDPPVVARVRVDTDWVQPFVTEFGGTVDDQDDDGGVVVLTVRHYESFRDRLLSFGVHARLLEPDALVDGLRDWLAGMAR